MENKEERRLLLSMESGRVNIREGVCPVPACGKATSRMDWHIKVHTELSSVAQEDILREMKRKRILNELAVLRKSNPVVPMVSTLDIEMNVEFEELDDPVVPQSPEEEEVGCKSPRCIRRDERHRSKIADLNEQVDTLSKALSELTRRYRKLKRKSLTGQGGTHLKQVTKRLLSSLDPEEEDNEPPASPEVLNVPSREAHSPQASTSQQATTSQQPLSKSAEKSPPHYPDHITVLSE
ncbi:MAG: hypothetical protein ACRDDA_11535 [Aeromonas sp.]